MAYQPNQLSFTQNSPLQEVGVPIVTASTTSGAAFAFGSSLFLDRLYVPGRMNLSECDMAISMAMATAASSTGSYGSIARTLVIYSFSNSTKLASFLSTSWSTSFVASNTTAGALTNLSQFVAGWTQAGGVVFPMTFASSELPPGDYVVGNLMSFSGSANATISLMGQFGSSLGVSSYGGAFLALSTSGSVTAFTMSQAASTGVAGSTFSSTISTLNFSEANSATSLSFALVGNSANSNIVSKAALGGIAPAFQYLGAGSATGSYPGIFQNGIYSTGAVPAAITLSNTVSLTSYGTTAYAQPWFALVGS